MCVWDELSRLSVPEQNARIFAGCDDGGDEQFQ
jgi:hypothetical protein